MPQLFTRSCVKCPFADYRAALFACENATEVMCSLLLKASYIPGLNCHASSSLSRGAGKGEATGSPPALVEGGKNVFIVNWFFIQKT